MMPDAPLIPIINRLLFKAAITLLSYQAFSSLFQQTDTTFIQKVVYVDVIGDLQFPF